MTKVEELLVEIKRLCENIEEDARLIREGSLADLTKDLNDLQD